MAVVAIAAPLLAYAIAVPANVSPTIASLVELVGVWLWHTPALHNAARHDLPTYIAEQATFLLTGLLLWTAVLHRRAEGIIALLLTAMHMTLLGALIAMSPRPLYSHSQLDDQHLGGAIMLLVGGIVYLSGGLALSGDLLISTSPGRSARMPDPEAKAPSRASSSPA